MGSVNPDNVHDIIDNLAEQKDLATDVANALGSTDYIYNDDELLQELDDIIKLPQLPIENNSNVNKPIENLPIEKQLISYLAN